MNINDALEYVDEHEYSNSKKYSTMDVAKVLAAEVRRLNSAKVNCATHGDMTFGLCSACQKVEKETLRSTIRRLAEMVSAAYTAGWMSGYSTGGTLEDESETNLDWHCGEDWAEDGLRPELLKIIESV